MPASLSYITPNARKRTKAAHGVKTARTGAAGELWRASLCAFTKASFGEGHDFLDGRRHRGGQEDADWAK